MTPSNAYWDRRAMQRMAMYHRTSDSTVTTILLTYNKAIRDINAEIEKIFYVFGRDGQMDPEKARKILNQRISNPLLALAKKIYPRIQNERIKRWLLNKMNAPAYRARLTRLQALKEQVYLQSKIIADVEITASTKGYVNTVNQAYYRTMFDIQKGLGAGFEFSTVPNKTVQEILKNPWSGKQFSNRIWSNTDVLAAQINEIITAGFKSGTNQRKMVAELQERMGVGKHAANRLIRTETTYMANAAEIESYKEAGIEKYIFVATLDLRTSEQCREHDLEEFLVEEAKAGVNLPPLHPYCRSTTRAKIDAGVREGIMRRARNPITGENELVPANMSYREWIKKYEVKK